MCNTSSMMEFFLLALTTFYITRFFTRGSFPLVAEPREAFVQRWGVYTGDKRVKDAVQRKWWVRAWRWMFAKEFTSIDGYPTNMAMKSLAYLLECDWCLGFWVASGTVLITQQFVSVPYPVLQLFAAAAITGLIAQAEPDSDPSSV